MKLAIRERRPRRSLREALLQRRDKLLASARFQRWAARFPFTRPLARRRATELFQLTAGFVHSQVLFACVKVQLLELLSEGPLAADDIARRLNLPEEGTRRLLAAAGALRLAQARGPDDYGLGDLGAAMLGNPSIAAMVAHHEHLYADLADPVALLRERGATRLSKFWPYALVEGHVQPHAPVADYSELMASSQAMIADHILDAFSLGRYHRLLDIAGGNGAFAAAALRRWPRLQATVFDLPAVAALASERFAREALAQRVSAVGGNMLTDALPGGADVASLVRVLHDHDDAPALQIMRAAHAVLPAGGRLLIAEPMAGTQGAEPVGDSYFGMYLWAMGSGRPRSAPALMAMARQAGFSQCREIATAMPVLVRVLVATV